jgi:hypothetical protein
VGGQRGARVRAHACPCKTWRGSPQRFAVATHLCVAFAHPQGGLQQCSDGLVGPAVTASACVLPAPFWRAYTAEDAGRACTIPASHGFAFDPIRALTVRHALTRSAARAERGSVGQFSPPSNQRRLATTYACTHVATIASQRAFLQERGCGGGHAPKKTETLASARFVPRTVVPRRRTRVRQPSDRIERVRVHGCLVSCSSALCVRHKRLLLLYFDFLSSCP